MLHMSLIYVINVTRIGLRIATTHFQDLLNFAERTPTEY